MKEIEGVKSGNWTNSDCQEICQEPIKDLFQEKTKLVTENTFNSQVDLDSSMTIPDALERSKALDHQQSFIVQAPAGSGKTSLLTQRFLKLLAYVEHPEECLAITFTRKAANEMRDRILNALNQAKLLSNKKTNKNSYEQQTLQLAKQVCERDHAKGWDLFDNPNRLKIQTIDAFCLNLTRQMPILSTFGASPQIMEDARPMYQSAARNLLNHLEKLEKEQSSNTGTYDDGSFDTYPDTSSNLSKNLKFLLRHLDNDLDKTERLLAELLPNRDQWLPTIGQTYAQLSAEKTSEKIRRTLESHLKDILQEALVALLDSLPPCFKEIVELANFAAFQLKTKQMDSPILACLHLKPHFSDNMVIHPLNLKNSRPAEELQEYLSFALGLKELLLTQDNNWRRTIIEQQGFPPPSRTKDKNDKALFEIMKHRMLDLLSQLNEYPDFRAQLQNIAECPSIAFSDEQWQINETLIQLLPILTAELSLVFQEQGQVDFVEVALNAQKALGDWDAPTDLALRLDYKINHILVDEFQDTSLTQFRLLEQLINGWQPGEGKSLFLVGDPMQSIYRFRQAEVGLFIRAKEKGIGAIPLTFLRLTTNFRSIPSLIDWCNQTFSSTFPAKDNITCSAIAFSASIAPSTATIEQDLAEVVHTVPEESEANKIVELILKTKTENPAASIAILVRSRSHLQDILPVLQRNKIEYQGIQLEKLNEHPIVQDLFSLTRALMHPFDRIAWLSILRAPFCKLSLQDLWVLASPQLFLNKNSSEEKNKENNKNTILPIMQNLQDYKCQPLSASLSHDAIQKLEKILPVLQNAILSRGRNSIRDWVQETWLQLGGIQTASHYDQNFLTDVEAFFEILEDVELLAKNSRQDTDLISVLEEKLKSHFTSPKTTADNAVQIMTIHKAKGLEFDTVIVPGVGRKVMADSKKLFMWENRAGLLKESYLILAPIQSLGAIDDPIYSYLRRQELMRAQHELQRLWYVAATRARKQLFWLTYS